MPTDITTLAIEVTTTQARKSLASFTKSLWRTRQVAMQLIAVPINLKAKVDTSELGKLDALRKQLTASSQAAEECITNLDGASASIVDVARASDAAAPTVSKLGGIMAGFFSTRKLLAFGKQSIAAFAEMENSVYKFNTTFAGITTTAEDVANSLKTTFKLSDSSTLEMLSSTGNLLQGFGFGKKESLAMADAVAKLGIDLASFHGYAGGAAGAVRALNSGLVGNTEALRTLGIVVNMESAQFKELYAQFHEGQGMTEAQAKAMAVLQTATLQGKNAIGDYLRPGETLNQLMADNAEAAERFRASVGAGLESSAKIAIKTMTSLMNVFNSLSEPVKNLITRTAALGVGWMALKTATASIAAAQAMFARMLGTNTVAMTANTAAVAGNTKSRSGNTIAVGAGSVALLSNSRAVAANALATAGAAKGFSLMGAASTVAAGGMKLLTRAIPFVGWALLALDAGMFVFDQFTAGSKAASEALEKEATKAREAGDAMRERNAEAVASFERLKTLATFEELHADEVKEAQTALENIRKVYPDVWITIDATTGKINIQADAFRNLNDAIQRLNVSDAGKELAALEKQIADVEGKYSGAARAFWTAAPGRDTNSEEYSTLFGVDSVAKHDRQISDQLKPLYERRAQLQQMIRSGGKITPAGADQAKNTSLSDANKGYRAAVKEYEKSSWNIDYATAGGSTKLQMLDDKIAAAQKELRGLQQRAAAGAVAPQGEADYKTQAVQKQTELLELERKRGALLQQNAQAQKAITAEFEQMAGLSRSPVEQTAALIQKLQTVKAEMLELQKRAASGELAPIGQKSYEDQYRDKVSEYSRLYSQAKQQRESLSGTREKLAAAFRSLTGQQDDPKRALAEITRKAQDAMQKQDYSGVLAAVNEYEQFKQQEQKSGDQHQISNDVSRMGKSSLISGIEANSSQARMLAARDFTRQKDDTTTLQKEGNRELEKMTRFLEDKLARFLQQNESQLDNITGKIVGV